MELKINFIYTGGIDGNISAFLDGENCESRLEYKTSMFIQLDDRPVVQLKVLN